MSEQFVTKEEWYGAQKFQADMIRDLKDILKSVPNEIGIIQEHLKGQDKLLFSIEEQTKKTNGRVNKLENKWYYIMGAFACCSVVGILVSYIWNTQVNNFSSRISNISSQLEAHIEATTK